MEEINLNRISIEVSTYNAVSTETVKCDINYCEIEFSGYFATISGCGYIDYENHRGDHITPDILREVSQCVAITAVSVWDGEGSPVHITNEQEKELITALNRQIILEI